MNNISLQVKLHVLLYRQNALLLISTIDFGQYSASLQTVISVWHKDIRERKLREFEADCQ